MKIRTGCQYAGYFHYSDHPNWASQHLRLSRGLDIAGPIVVSVSLFEVVRVSLVTRVINQWFSIFLAHGPSFLSIRWAILLC